MSSEARPQSCLHCSLPVLGAGEFCCRGCQSVYTLLNESNLQDYYNLRRGPGVPVVDLPKVGRNLDWLDDILEQRTTGQPIGLDIQGMHCSGCVWVLEKTFDKQKGALKIVVNPALGTVQMWVGPDFSVVQWIHSVERFGYRFGPALKSSNTTYNRLLLRLGICVAIAMNIMMLSTALYLGLDEGPLYRVFRNICYGLATASVLIGGPVFFRSAIAGLQNRVLHFDVPISLGIVLAFAGSSWAFWSGRDDALYLDSVSVFVALMLLGRTLQERILTDNRNRILASSGTAGLYSKRQQSDGTVQKIPCSEIVDGDRILIVPGDLVPVACEVLSASAAISTDWISGESRSCVRRQGEALQAGSFNAGNHAFSVRATESFDSSALHSLLSAGQDDSVGVHRSGLAHIIARYYVLAVLGAALTGFLLWAFSAGIPQAIEVATAILIVTCPCAFGIATPLAHEIVQANLRRRGLYIRNGDFLHRASTIDTIVFDKTGTLSTGEMQLDPASVTAIDGLDAEAKHALFQLTLRSNHPVSTAIYQLLAEDDRSLDESFAVVEDIGNGIASQHYRLGRADWAQGTHHNNAGTVLVRDGRTLAKIQVHEEPRCDAAEEILGLQRDGFSTFLLSGDGPEQVRELATRLHIPAKHCFSEQQPRDKEAWIRRHDRGNILFVGDGINDSLAAQAATCSGTPALDRPYMAGHCDFYLATCRLSPVRTALIAAKRLSKVIRRNLYFAVAYNGFAVALACAGVMRPWMAAILMPASSIAIVLTTIVALKTTSAPRSRKPFSVLTRRLA